VLAEMIPPVAVRLRRDFGSLLALIRAHALLHRASREVDENEGVVATIEDYGAVRELVVDLISDGIGSTVSEATRETVNAVAEIITGDVRYASNAQLPERLELDKAAVSRPAEEVGAVVVVQPTGGALGIHAHLANGIDGEALL
jgi:hypothetical protein